MGSAPPTVYCDRLERELNQLAAAGLAGDVLRVHAVSRAAAREGLASGSGRGAAPGSLVLWSLGITGVDPIRGQLHFERWLNPLRDSAPDIGLEVPEANLERLARAVPREVGEARVRLGFLEPLEVPWVERRAAVAAGARSCFESFPRIRVDAETWIAASRTDLDRDAHVVDLIGLPVLATVGAAGESDDDAIGFLLARGRVEGVHFLDRVPEAVTLLTEARPSRREDLAALLALCRPGPIAAGMTREYLGHCRSNRRGAPPHPAVESILRPTRGMLIYQEQLMTIARAVAGFGLAEADLFWRELVTNSDAVGAIRSGFCRRCLEGGMSFEEASSLFSWLRRRAGLLFNRAHMLASTSLIARSAAARAIAPGRYLARLRSAEAAARQRLRRDRSRVASAFG